jgi:hypothetical protein
VQPKIIKDDGSLDYEALGVEPPKHFEHGSDADIRAMMVKAIPIRWFQRGNELVADTELGELVNFIPTDMQLIGVDKDNMPILKKLAL